MCRLLRIFIWYVIMVEMCRGETIRRRYNQSTGTFPIRLFEITMTRSSPPERMIFMTGPLYTCENIYKSR